MGGSHTGVLIPSSPCPHYLCLNMPRFSCVSLRVCYLSCSAKHPASMAAKLPVWPSPPAPLDSLLPGSCTECTFYFFALGCPWYCEPTSSAASACGRWVRSPTHPFPRSSLGGVRGGGSVGCARAHARLSTRPCARPAPPAQRSERLSLPLSAPRSRCRLQAWVLSVGPLAPRQEDEFEEDAWAREYRDGCGPGGNRARAEDGLRADDPPCGWLRTLAWYRHSDPDRDSGQPLPQPTPEGRKEGKVSEGAGAGRERPPVRLETVATATGLRSPATRLRGGDAPSPTTAGGAGGGKGVHCGESIALLASLGVPASARRGWG